MIAGEPVELNYAHWPHPRKARIVNVVEMFPMHVRVLPDGEDSSHIVHRRQVRRVLTERQRRAYKHLAAQGYIVRTGSGSGLWPPGATWSDLGPAYSRQTLTALVDAGVASWSENRCYITHRPIGG